MPLPALLPSPAPRITYLSPLILQQAFGLIPRLQVAAAQQRSVLVWALDDQTTVTHGSLLRGPATAALGGQTPAHATCQCCPRLTLLLTLTTLPLQVLNLSAHKRAVVDVQWNLHDVNVMASGASDGSIALIDIRHPHHVIQSMASSEGMTCLR